VPTAPAKIALPKIRRPDKLRGVPSPAHRRLFPLAAWLLLCAWLCGLLSPSRVEAVTTTPAKIASWGAGVSASGRLSNPSTGNQDGIRVGEPCAYESVSGLPEWLSRDPIGEDGGLNLYGYVRNNPANLIDPLGLDWASWNSVVPPSIGTNPAFASRANTFEPTASLAGLGIAGAVTGASLLPEAGLALAARYPALAAAAAYLSHLFGGTGEDLSSGLGDLTVGEVNAIQAVVNRAGRPLCVVGSAAKGARKPGSDIDYLSSGTSLPYFDGLEHLLPGIDPAHGIIPGAPNPFLGPSILFQPKSFP
jgi:hypothetical protein